MRAYRKVDEGYELKIEGGRLILLGVGALLTLVLVFLVGVLVGKGLWREPLPPLVASPEPVQEAPAPPPAQAPPHYTFYDDLKNPDGPEETVPAAPAGPAEPPAETPVLVAPAPDAPPKGQPPDPPATPSPEPPPKAPALLPAPQFTIQVGSFRDRASAEGQAAQIGAQGVSAQVVPISMEGRTWYRVQVGRFSSRAEAEAHYQQKLRSKGVQGFVTAR